MKLRRTIKIYIIGTNILFPIILLVISPHWPKTFIGWGMLYVFTFIGLPFWAIGEWLGEIITHRKVSNWIDNGQEAGVLSLLRISYVLGAMFSLFSIVLMTYVLINHKLWRLSFQL